MGAQINGNDIKCPSIGEELRINEYGPEEWDWRE